MAVGSQLPPSAGSDSEQEDATPGSALDSVEEIARSRRDFLQFLKRASIDFSNEGEIGRPGKMQRLYEQLVSLRSVVPYLNPNRETPCVISDALEYKEHLKKQLQQLNQIESEVNVSVEDKRVLIRVCCDKRPKLLPSLMEEIEMVDLAYEEVNISCGDKLVIRALGLQTEGRQVQIDEVKKRLVSIIRLGLEDSTLPPSKF